MLAAPHQQNERAAENPSILIVDDEHLIRRLMRRVLQNEFELVFAENGVAALAVLEAQTFDLVLLDVTMPGMDGFDVLAQIRSNPRTADLPVILISALQNNTSVVRGLQLGANDYITKPLDTAVVRARVGTQLALKRAADERKQIIAQLKSTQEMQESFTRIVSHDLKGPLTNIRMAQFMLRDILHDNDEARNILDNMDMTLNDMVEMIRTFLDAMDAQQLEPEITTVEVHDLVYQVIEQYRINAERKQIRVTMRNCEVQAKADARLLRQTLANLVSNALKFSLPGTTASIWCEQSAGNRVRICVGDEGPGIPPHERDKLFVMFGKLSPRPTAGESSTGLGLWVVKQLTELQKGRVGVDYPADGGSVFWIELPGA
jgi:two-component system, sensor histidine kinase and response regulator